MSVFAAVTARMTALGAVMYSRHIARSCASMSAGWSPVGTCTRARGGECPTARPDRLGIARCWGASRTLVSPGMSTSVRFKTLGEKNFRVMGWLLMPRLAPTTRSVSARISPATSSKSKYL